MRNRRRSLTISAGLAIIIAIALALSNPTRTIHAQVNPNLEGTWHVIVTPDGGTPFHALATYNAGGTLVESSDGGDDDKGGQGVWIRTGGRTFGFTLEQFMYDPSHKFVGTLKVRESDTFDSGTFNSYSGVADIESRDPAGNLLFAGCARTRATRMVVETPNCH